MGRPHIATVRRQVGSIAVLFALSLTPNLAVAETTAAEQTQTYVGDVAAGAKRYKRECRQCHGPKGKGASSYPKLIGHPADFLVDRLERYRAGEKIGPNTPLMAPRAKKLKDKDIADLTAFILSLQDS